MSPNNLISRYSENLDGLELTLWMITDFMHLLNTDHVVDGELARFNKERRSGIILPDGWGSYTEEKHKMNDPNT